MDTPPNSYGHFCRVANGPFREGKAAARFVPIAITLVTRGKREQEVRCPSRYMDSYSEHVSEDRDGRSLDR
jgi:hypothetical protein